MPTFAEIVSVVTDFVADNVVLVAAAAVLGTMAAVFARLIRSGR